MIAAMAALRRVLLVAALASLALGAARASNVPEPTIDAQLLLPIPDDPRVLAIEPRDDSDENLLLRDQMAARVREQNGRVVADAPLVLRFSTGVVSGRDTPRDGPPNRHGLYGGGRAPPNAVPVGTPVSYRVSVTLERRDGPILWRADATLRVDDLDEAELSARLAQVLVDNIGRTIGTLRPGGAWPDPSR